MKIKNQIIELYESNIKILQSPVSEYTLTLALGACIELLKLMYRTNMVNAQRYLKEFDYIQVLYKKGAFNDNH